MGWPVLQTTPHRQVAGIGGARAAFMGARRPPVDNRGMSFASRRAALHRMLHAEWQHLLHVQPSGRGWLLPLAAALATGLPFLAGAALGDIEAALTGSLGGLTFLHLRDTPLRHRMTALVACGLGLTACFALGLAVHALGSPVLRVPLLALVALMVTLVVRYYRMPPPGPLFFVMTAAIGAYAQVPMARMPVQLAALSGGVVLAVCIAYGYSRVMLARQPAPPLPAPVPAGFDAVVVDAVIIAAAVGTSLLLAEWLRLPRPYWVPVSCMAVVQGATLRAVWNRQLQRVIGTGLGVALAGALLMLPLDPLRIAVLVMALTVVIEWLVVRHYGMAVVFITPLTILLAEAPAIAHSHVVDTLVQARLADTVLGCAVGLVGGIGRHSPRLRAAVARPLRALVPWR